MTAATTWESVIAALDELAYDHHEIRYHLREVRESRWCTGTFLGSYRAPSLSDLQRLLSHYEDAVADTLPPPAIAGEGVA